jgi:hypothetical protein
VKREREWNRKKKTKTKEGSQLVNEGKKKGERECRGLGGGRLGRGEAEGKRRGDSGPKGTQPLSAGEGAATSNRWCVECL